MEVLAIASHPDDIELGSGGTLARHIQDGDNVSVIVMTNNYRSPNIFSHMESSMKVLGIQKVIPFMLNDSYLDVMPRFELAQKIESVVKTAPDIVYTHYENDLSQDHRATFWATMTVFRPVWEKPISIYSFEIPAGSEWGSDVFRPNYFVDINGTLEKKIKALSYYKTEMREEPHPRSPEVIRARAEVWGSYCGLRNAEAFILVRGVK